MTGIARSFDAVPDLYDEVRPEYAPEVYDVIAQAVGDLADLDVLDLAAGTGLVFRQLLARGASTVAVEPSEPMLGPLVARSPGARALAANAEALPFHDSVFDLATCGTAWHWVRPEPTLAELRRVLRPEGHVALFWAINRWGDGIAWEDAQSAVFERWESPRGSVPPTPEGVRPSDAAADLRARGIEVVVETEFNWQRTVSRELHLRTLQTHSNNLVLEPSDREQLLAEIEAALEPWPEITERLWGPLVIARFKQSQP